MAKQKTTKKALVLSALALFVCVAMFIGSTFAWFTDSVTSAGNVIQSGTLKVAMDWADGTKAVPVDESNDWKDASTGKIFNYDKWEPGYTQVRHIRIANEGTLALKYQLNIVADGEVSELADVIDVYYVDPAVQVANRADLVDDMKLGTLTEVLKDIDTSASGNLLPGKSDTITLALKMQENAGNEYQGLAIGSDFAVQLVATQYTHEEDSFNDQYDKDAEYPLLAETIDTGSTLEDIQNLFDEGGSFYVAESMNFTNTEATDRYTRLTIDKNVKLYAADDAVITVDETFSLLGNGSLTVYGGQFKVKEEFFVGEDFSLIFEGGNHTVGTLTGAGEIIVNGGIINSLANFGGVEGIYPSENARLIINGGVINLYGCINLNWNNCDNVYVEINSGTINLCNGVDKLFAVRNIMAKDRDDGHALRGSSIRIKGGVFNTTYEIDNTGDANAFIRNEDSSCDTTRVLDSNIYNGEKQYDCVVTGGTFYGSWMRTGETSGTDVCENTIAGFVADGYQITGDETNGYVVSAK